MLAREREREKRTDSVDDDDVRAPADDTRFAAAAAAFHTVAV